MKDYYTDFIKKNSGNIPESKVSKVSEPSFDTFDTEYTYVNPEKFSLDELLKDEEMREQFEFEIEERTAILIFEEGISETQAPILARQSVEETWLALFVA